MKRNRLINTRVYTRAVVAIMLFSSWGVVALSGLLLWLAPSGRQSGQMELLLGLTKEGWSDIHFWVSLAAIIITVIHVIIDWKALRGVMRYMASVHRETGITQN